MLLSPQQTTLPLADRRQSVPKPASTVDIVEQESLVQLTPSPHETGLLPTQTPALHTSVWVQALASEQVLVLSFV